MILCAGMKSTLISQLLPTMEGEASHLTDEMCVGDGPEIEIDGILVLDSMREELNSTQRLFLKFRTDRLQRWPMSCIPNFNRLLAGNHPHIKAIIPHFWSSLQDDIPPDIQQAIPRAHPHWLKF